MLRQQLIHLLGRDVVDLVDSDVETIIFYCGEVRLQRLGESLVNGGRHAERVRSGENLGGVVRRGSQKEEFTVSFVTVLGSDGGSNICAAGDREVRQFREFRVEDTANEVPQHHLKQHGARSYLLSIVNRAEEESVQLRTLEVDPDSIENIFSFNNSGNFALV